MAVSRFQLRHAALTPLQFTDLVRSTIDPGNGREEFSDRVCAYLDANSTASFPSRHASIGAILDELRSDAGTANRVLIPRYGCRIFPHGIRNAGLEPTFCEMDPETLT